MKTAILPRSVEVLDKLELDVPPSWNDFSRKQLLKACDLFVIPKEKNKFMVKAAMDLLGLELIHYRRTQINNLYTFRYKKSVIVLDAEQVRFIYKHLEFLLKESDLTVNRIPEIRIRWRKFYGPEKRLYNVCYDEFRSAENFFLAFNKTKDNQYLNLLMATLYRPRKKGLTKNSLSYEGDLRESFNSFVIEKRAKLMKRVPMKYKIAAFQYFFGCMNNFKEMFPMVFEVGSGGVIHDRVYQSLKVLDWLNQGDVTRNKSILQSNVYEVMTRMQTEREKIKQIEKLNRK